MHEYSALVLIEFFTWILENVKSINLYLERYFSTTVFSFFSRCVIAVMTSGKVCPMYYSEMYDFHGKKVRWVPSRG